MFRHLISNAQRFLPYVAFAGGSLNLLFWILYFANIIVLSGEGEAFVSKYESAFPIADAFLGMLLLLAGIGLLKKAPFGTFFLVAAAAMAVYLGILDVTFYGSQGLYFPLTMSSLFALFVNAACIGGGAFGLWLGWNSWRGR